MWESDRKTDSKASKSQSAGSLSQPTKKVRDDLLAFLQSTVAKYDCTLHHDIDVRTV